MPKATLTFQLPEEQEEFHMAVKANRAHIALLDMDQFLRSKIKYEELTEEQNELYQSIRDKLREILLDRDVNI